MNTSTEKSANAGHSTQNCATRDDAVGLCANCGHKISVCGRPFTADIECSKCHVINEFVRSQQPVSVRGAVCNADESNH
jgi:hypothetical protein